MCYKKNIWGMPSLQHASTISGRSREIIRKCEAGPLVIIIIIVTISLILYLTHRYPPVTYHQCYISTAIKSKLIC